MEHAKKKDFRWFTTISDGCLGIHKDKLKSLSMSDAGCFLFLEDGKKYELHPEHYKEAANVFATR
jgi:hypothetical protein